MLKKMKLKQSNGEGFTIIEVMIVLAIAALILLIVLLAVPALQRSSRNTQRKNDVSAIAAAVSNVLTDNNGATPTGLGATDSSDILICGAGGAANGPQTTGNCTGVSESAKMGYYTTSDVSMCGPGTAGAANCSAAVPTTNAVRIEVGYICTNNAPVASAGTRTAALYYVVEGGSGNNAQCIEQ
jgi:prepilin-type N-terminal cleavage/methylation domain-containing protein